MVVMDRADYFKKLAIIINDRSKFKNLGPAEKYDRTARVETKLNKVLRELKDGKELSESTYNHIKFTSASRPSRYGLPKTHKEEYPLRPILTMISSAQHKLAQHLSRLLQSVSDRFYAFCVKGSFTFANLMKESKFDGVK